MDYEGIVKSRWTWAVESETIALPTELSVTGIRVVGESEVTARVI